MLDLPGRTKRSLVLQYDKMRREKRELFTSELVKTHAYKLMKDNQLREAVRNYEKNKWINIGRLIGVSAAGCKKRAAEMKIC